MKSAFGTFLFYLSCDWVASVGAIIVTTAALVFVPLTFASSSNPYYGLLVFLLVPAAFVFGLLLIPLGVWRCSRRVGGFKNIVEIKVNEKRTARIILLIAFLTVINVAIVSGGAYQSMEYMDSNQFCGRVCHLPMTPQYVAYQDSAHSHVDCVTCHIGPGTKYFIHYKLAGLRQLYGLTTNKFHRPIMPAIDTLRPSLDTCERCHPAEQKAEDKLRIIRHYDSDEHNSEKVTVLLMRVGTKIHKAHVGQNIEFMTSDPARQDIPWVSLNGVEYKSGDAVGQRHKMDCLDCHNEPAHSFQMPEDAVDKALASGELDRSVPFAKRDAVLALVGKKPIESALPAVRKIYARNVFPEMAVTWGSYPNNLGHDASIGCFRCHDDNHKSSSGKTITQDCGTCHEVLAVSEENPAILKQLGMIAPQ